MADNAAFPPWGDHARIPQPDAHYHWRAPSEARAFPAIAPASIKNAEQAGCQLLRAAPYPDERATFHPEPHPQSNRNAHQYILSANRVTNLPHALAVFEKPDRAMYCRRR